MASKKSSPRTRQKPYRYPEWIHTQLENLMPNQWFIIPSHVTPTLNEKNFRCMISRNNVIYGLNLKFHKDSTTYPDRPPQWWIWYDPSPKIKRLYKQEKRYITPESLKELQTLNTSLRENLDADNFKEAAIIQAKMDEIKAEWQRRPPRLVYKRKGSITHPLKDILEHLHMSKHEWERIHPDERIRLRIRTDLELKWYGTMRKP